MSSSTSDHQSAFAQALEEFKKGLKKREEEEFKATSFKTLEDSIANLERQQSSSRRQKALKRLKPFLDFVEEFGKVIDLFCNCNDFVPFIWGPMKFLLMVTSTYAEAFEDLIETYKRIGESLPLLVQYEKLFSSNPQLVRALSLIYKDILVFHRDALRYFKQTLWKQFFATTWKSYKIRFGGVIADMAAHRSLIESHATLAVHQSLQTSLAKNMELFLAERAENDRKRHEDRNEENMRRSQEVSRWLKATDVERDQYDLTTIRDQYPGTGRWLLEHPKFKDWFDETYATIPPLLWLSGKPGSGKTVLASLIVEEARRLKSTPIVLYFYFRHQDPERDNFIELARSLLQQFLNQDPELLSYIYERQFTSGQAFLTDPGLAIQLLQVAFDNCKSAYIILDGIDECSNNNKERDSRKERKNITSWFRKLVDDLSPSEAARIRCLFISQDDGLARKDFAKLSHLDIKMEDNQHDIDEYCHIESKTLKETFDLKDSKIEDIAKTVARSVDGIFLLAKLIWMNLAEQDTLDDLYHELKPGNFPESINDAYQKIMLRIDRDSTSSKSKSSAVKVLEWLMCCKRPLKWYEIQIMNSTREGEVDLERYRIRREPKDLCHSLIEERSDGTIEFIHRTVKAFLAHKKYGRMDQISVDLQMALLCLDYLNLPAFIEDPEDENVLNGDYGFMDYAVLNWVEHLEAGLEQISRTEDEDEDEDENEDELERKNKRERESYLELIEESLEVFLSNHWNDPTDPIRVRQKTKRILECYSTADYFEKLVQAVESAKEQLNHYGKMKDEQIALDLAKTVKIVRGRLEDVFSRTEPTDLDDFKRKYGTDIFKCQRLSCDFFTSGFLLAEKRDDHLRKHDRPFRCGDENCWGGYKIGFASKSDLDKHNRENHSDTKDDHDKEFPTESEVQKSVQRQRSPEPESQPDPDPKPVSEEIREKEIEVAKVPQEVEQPKPQQSRPAKRIRQTEFKCDHCGNVYKKKFNLQSHLHTHSTEKKFRCQFCNQGFVRKNDCRRHEDSVHKRDENAFVCSGCKKNFARADILRKHYESIAGNACRNFSSQRDEIQLQL